AAGRLRWPAPGVPLGRASSRRRSTWSDQAGLCPLRANSPTLTTSPADPNNPIDVGTLGFENFENIGNHLTVGGRVGFYPIPEFEVGYGFQYGSVRPAGSGFSDVNALLESVDATYVRESERLKGILNLHAQWVWSQIDRLDYGVAGVAPLFSNN